MAGSYMDPKKNSGHYNESSRKRTRWSTFDIVGFPRLLFYGLDKGLIERSTEVIPLSTLIVAIGISSTVHVAVLEGRSKLNCKAYKHYVSKIQLIIKGMNTAGTRPPPIFRSWYYVARELVRA
jgi:hypothetical protein